MTLAGELQRQSERIQPQPGQWDGCTRTGVTPDAAAGGAQVAFLLQHQTHTQFPITSVPTELHGLLKLGSEALEAKLKQSADKARKKNLVYVSFFFSNLFFFFFKFLTSTLKMQMVDFFLTFCFFLLQ